MTNDNWIRYLEEDCAPPHAIPMTLEEFDAWIEEEMRAEYNGGNAYIKGSWDFTHGGIYQFLICIAGHIARNVDGHLAGSRYQLRLPGARFEPDLQFVNKANLWRFTEWYLDGPPNMIIEIVAPETAARDWHDKYLEYEKGGVLEYWLIDYSGKRCDCYNLVDGRYTRSSMIDGKIHSSQLEGFYLRPEWLWTEPHPKMFETLQEMGQL